jgi:MFS family permease
MKRSTVPLLGLLAANVLSMTGNVAALVAIPWYVLQTTGSASKTGLSAFFNFLPVALAGFLGGTVVDRFGFKRTSVIADAASGLSIASIPLLHATIGLEYWQLLLLVFLGALLDTPGTTARAALIPEAAELADVSLERATSLADAVNRLSTLVGGPLAGLLIALFGASNVLWVDAATFALSAALIGACIPRGLSGDSPEGQSSYLEDLGEGFRYLRRDHLVLSVLLIFTGSNFLDAAFFSVILPFFAQVELGSAVSLGLIVGASGAGALLGAIAYGWIGHALSLAWARPKDPVMPLRRG